MHQSLHFTTETASLEIRAIISARQLRMSKVNTAMVITEGRHHTAYQIYF
jgi:hypothetical protein